MHATGGDAGASRLWNAQGELFEVKGRSDGWIPWAELLKRVFARDELTCERCGSRMQVIALVRKRESVRKFLRAVGVGAEVPIVAPARSPPQLELWN